MKTKTNNKRISIRSIAKGFNSRSRACHRCPLLPICDRSLCKVCSNSFVEGFIKGYNYNKKVIKDKALQKDERDEIRIYKYIAKGLEHEVGCDYWTYLFLKLTYSDEGLTDVEYKEYKKHHGI